MARKNFEVIQIGDVYGNWTVVDGPTVGSPAHRKWGCRCSCGDYHWVNANSMVRGISTQCLSCASTKPDRMFKKLGVSYVLFRRLRMVVRNAISRCTRSSDSAYHNYGGRGVSVCPEWVEDENLFIAHLITLPGHDNPDLVLDRIDNDGRYEKGNLRFITHVESNLNRRLVGESRQYINAGFKRSMKKLRDKGVTISAIAELYCTQRHVVRRVLECPN